MAGRSRFSTKENYDRLTEAMRTIDEGIRELNIAVEAGIPDAEKHLKAVEEQRAKLQQIIDTYFPGGVTSATVTQQ